MSKSRRDFLTLTSLGVLGAATALPPSGTKSLQLPPGAPPAFGAGPAFGPEVSSTTFAEAEKLVQFPLTAAERDMAASSWRRLWPPSTNGAPARGNSPWNRQSLQPATIWNPLIPGLNAAEQRDRFLRSSPVRTPLPAKDEDIAFAPVTHLSRWIENRQAHFEPADPHLSRSAGEVQSASCAAPSPSRATCSQAGQAGR